MKHITLILILFFGISCTAQTPVVSYNSNNITDGCYVKDLNNDLDKFTGTWIYTEGNTELTVVLIKKEQTYNGIYYTDELEGNYKYVENGVEIVNTLANDINEETTISGSELFGGGLEFSFTLIDPGKSRASYSLDLKHLGTFIPGGITKMQWKLMQVGFYSAFIPGETPPTNAELDQTMRLPKEVTLIKQ